jgi:hypothetical protein
VKLTVIGSTGRTGRLVLADAARRGHRVTAFTRRPHELPELPAAVRVVHGDGRKAQDVREAVAGSDAVIAIVAASKRSGPHQTAEVAGGLTEQMAALDVPRLVITSAYPIVGTTPRVPIALLRLMLADAYADVRTMESIVTQSDVDWRIVRLNRLTDRPAIGASRISRDVFARPTAISRADAAAVLLDIAADDGLARTAVNVAGS